MKLEKRQIRQGHNTYSIRKAEGNKFTTRKEDGEGRECVEDIKGKGKGRGEGKELRKEIEFKIVK